MAATSEVLDHGKRAAEAFHAALDFEPPGEAAEERNRARLIEGLTRVAVRNLHEEELTRKALGDRIASDLLAGRLFLGIGDLCEDEAAVITERIVAEVERRAWKAERADGNGHDALTAEALKASCQQTELGNAYRFILTYHDQVRFLPQSGRFLVWDGRRWARDETGRAQCLAKETALAIWDEIRHAQTSEERDQLAAFAKRSESARAIEAMLRLAETPLPNAPSITVTVEQLDRDPWALNVMNGTLDLRTGRLKPHRRKDLCTKLAPVEFYPDAPCDHWLDFLALVFDHNADLIDYVQRAIGYSLTGDVSEQVLFFLHGTGENGKSTLVETISGIMGDYARVAAPGLLLAQKTEAHPTGLADLAGARFVSSIEAEEGRRLAEVLVKWLTGGDRLKARFMKRDFFEFAPTFKLWFAANHKPTVRGTDHAIWRRIPLIPFEVCIPKVTTVDRDFKEKLRAEYPGILRWAVQGCLRWQSQRLAPPAEVRAATERYRSEMDIMGQFLAERCQEARDAETAGKELYVAYTSWCEENGERAASQKSFSMKLEDRGFVKRHTEKGQVWPGVRLS